MTEDTITSGSAVLNSEETSKRKYWYFIDYEECVLCGKSYTYRHRRYTPKPEKWDDRHNFEEFACDGHFM